MIDLTWNCSQGTPDGDGFYCLLQKTLAKRGKRNCQSSEAESLVKFSSVGLEPSTVRSPVERSNPLGHRAPLRQPHPSSDLGRLFGNVQFNHFSTTGLLRASASSYFALVNLTKECKIDLVNTKWLRLFKRHNFMQFKIIFVNYIMIRRKQSIKGALYRIQIICQRYTFWSYPARLTIADPPG